MVDVFLNLIVFLILLRCDKILLTVIVRNNCGLRVIATILKPFEEVMEGVAGKVLVYSTIRN